MIKGFTYNDLQEPQKHKFATYFTTPCQEKEVSKAYDIGVKSLFRKGYALFFQRFIEGKTRKKRGSVNPHEIRGCAHDAQKCQILNNPLHALRSITMRFRSIVEIYLNRLVTTLLHKQECTRSVLISTI